ncbi:MAG: HAD family phosphatase [Lachnospiraceae bacterium]|jgi:HAD superfamily hydrolase (TIGR01509 family)|nr:HAD family phosphatase [Lachnospiraceae bacterium]
METRKIKGVIFDQDGLLFDTERISIKAWDLAGNEMGFHLEESFLCTIRGANANDAARKFKERFGEAYDFLKLRGRKQEIFVKMLREMEMPVKPGVKELLTYLREEGYKIAMATASAREYSMDNLRLAGIDGFFDYVITGDMVKEAKPNPEIFLKAAEALGEKPDDCLVLEDSLNGVEAGLKGGFVTVMVPDLTQPDEVLRQRLDRVCSSLLEVRDWLMEA